jgi:serpin B
MFLINLLSTLLLNLHFTTSFFPYAQETGHNVLFSPLSLQQGLGMVAEVAEGETKQEILETLCLSPDDAARRLNSKKILENLNQKKSLTLANGAWLSSDFIFTPLETELISFYEASLHAADFKESQEETREEINAWVNSKTKIPELLPEGSIDPFTKLVLVNTLYLKAPWAHSFDPKMGFEAPFYGLEKSLRPIPFMRKLAPYGYLEESNYSVIEMPFKEDLSLFVVLPKEGVFLKEVESKLTTRLLQHWLEDIETESLDLSLPKFKVATSLPAKELFQKMGMKLPFDRHKAQFGLGEGVVITDILHQAVFEVDEWGGTGSAATGVVIGVTCIPLSKQVVVNRPFLIFVADKTTQTILFAGRILQPKI